MLKDIIEVKPLNDYQLYLKFEDDRDGIIDLKEIIEFVGIFEPLKELAFFKTVKICFLSFLSVSSILCNLILSSFFSFLTKFNS